MSDKEYLFDDMDEGAIHKLLEEGELELLDPLIRQLIEYINNVAKDKARPKRAEINPSEIQNLLPYISIMDVIVENDELIDVKVRLMGTELVNIYGEVTGKLISEYHNEKVSKRIIDGCKFSFDTKAVIAGGAYSFDDERSFIKLKKVLIPLFDDENDKDKVTKIINLVVFNT